jgi:hypothetical protein
LEEGITMNCDAFILALLVMALEAVFAISIITKGCWWKVKK